MWCGGNCWVLKRQVWGWNGDVGVSGSDEVGLKVQPHLARVAEWCFPRQEKMREEAG